MASSRTFVLSLLACGSVAAIVIACGTENGSVFGGPDSGTPLIPDGAFGDTGAGPNDDLYKNDPPPPWCGPDAGAPPPITGTADCPDDKNKPGCGCTTIGETAPCWTGYRRNRHLGICKDGTTKCMPQTETTNVWGACEGEVLPKPDAGGVDGCGCFTHGIWKIANTSPCAWTNNGTDYYAYSTKYDPDHQTTSGCTPGDHVAPGATTGGIWATDTLTVDCAGTFKLCFRIRAGTYESPNPNDCILGETCIDAAYDKENVEQKMPDLQPWAGTNAACAKKWEKETPETVSPGYGEMVVKGKTVRCDAIDDGQGNEFVFHRVKYCPRICREADAGSLPECVDCQLKSTGEFK